MSDQREIRDNIKKLAGTFNKDIVNGFPCTVNSVDLTAQTCTVTPIGSSSTTQITDVQLNAEQNDGFLIIPSINSTVWVMYATQNLPYIAMYSNIDGIQIITSTGQQLIMNNKGIQLNDGSLGGLVILGEIYAAISRLETMFNTHIHSTPSGPSGVPTILITPATTQDQLENKQITQGV